ncbi:sulfite exporter TauE/SafE family protein [bacterium LRH843]|nr:sulfite exporter TauE/SafE family protein [bacterium LRH843]
MPWEFIFIFIILLIGSFIQGTTGFGLGLFAMGFLPMLLPLRDSSLLVMSLAAILSLSIVIKMYKYIEIKSFWVILAAAFTGRILSFIFLTSFGDIDSMKRLLGIFLISMVVYLLFFNKKEASSSMMHPVVPIILGFCGGFIGGVFAVGGPFFVFYFLMLYKEKHSYNANLQLTLFLSNLFTIILHTIHGDLNLNHSMYFLIGIFSVIIGSSVGLRLFERIPREKVQRSAMAVVLIAGLNLLIFS